MTNKQTKVKKALHKGERKLKVRFIRVHKDEMIEIRSAETGHTLEWQAQVMNMQDVSKLIVRSRQSIYSLPPKELRSKKK